MGVRISDMDPFGGMMNDNDLFEMTRTDERKTYSISAQLIAEYCKTLNNGGYKGATDKSLDEFTQDDTGVYYWSGEAPIVGMPSNGLLEVVGYVKPATGTSREKTTVVERLTAANQVYTRSFSAQHGWSSWAVLSNVNGNRILSGTTKEGSINFNSVLGRTSSDGPYFDKRPNVVLTPINTSKSKVCIINLATIDNTGFTVLRFSSDVVDVQVKTETTKTTETSKTTETTTTATTRGAWVEGDFEYMYVATLDG